MKKKEKCVTCSTTSNDCVECSEGWYPLDHECAECSTNNCATCDSTNGNCKTCNEDRYYEENKCILCNEGVEHCIKCHAKEECFECESDQYFLENSTTYNPVTKKIIVFVEIQLPIHV